MRREIEFWLNVKDKPKFIVAIINTLAGNAKIGFSGDLSSFEFNNILKSEGIEIFEMQEEQSIVLKLEKEKSEHSYINTILKIFITQNILYVKNVKKRLKMMVN